MQSSIELALKTQNYHKYMSRVQDTVNGMQWTIETLLMTVDIHRADQTSERIVIKNLLISLCNEADRKFGEKEVRLVWEPTTIIETSRGALTTVLSNLIDNAWKYHEWESAISISRSWSEVVIMNISPSLSQDDLWSIWTPFWQLKTWAADWQGLGLSLVDSVASHMWWDVTITMQQEPIVVTTLRFTS
jgi:K+-sensing histidine kinase KdpD